MATHLIRKLERRFSLSESDRRAIVQACTKAHRVSARLDLIAEGETPDRVHLIQQGFACRYKILPDGSRAIMALLVPGDLCDLHVTILGEMDHSIAALTPCEVITIPHETIEDLTTRYPTISRALDWAGLVDEAILRTWLVSMGRRPANQRLAHLFCELLMRLQAVELATGNSYELPLTQSDLADTTGLTSVHVNRVLRSLREQALIVLTGRTLSIPDFGRLKAFAEFNPNYLHHEPKQQDWRKSNGDRRYAGSSQ